MSKLKRILGAVLVSVMAISLVACGGSDKSDIEKVLTNYMDAAKKCDFKTAFSYLDEAPGEEFNFENRDEFVEYMSDQMAEAGSFAGYEDDLKNIITKIADKVFDSIEYTIKSVDIDGDNATATLEVSMISQDSLDFEKVIANSDFDFESYITELITNGTIKSEEDVADAIMPKLIELIDEALEKAESEKKDEEIKLSRKDGKWLISKESDEFMDILTK